MEKREILQKLIDYYAKGNKSEFGRILGLSPQAITSWLRRNTFNAELINAKCININSDWLLTGEGEMTTKNGGQESIPTSIPESKPSGNLEKILLSMQNEVSENNKMMREQMSAMQTLLQESLQLMKKSQEYYERALELHEQRDGQSLPHHHKISPYVAENVGK